MDEQNNKPDLEENKNGEGNNTESGDGFRNEIVPRISPITAGIIGLVGGFFLYQIVGGLLTLLIFGVNLQNAPVNSLRLMTMAGQTLFILLPALVFSKMFYEDVTEIIRFHLPKLEEILLFGAGIIILTPLLQYYIAIQEYFIDTWAQSSALINSIKTNLDKLNSLVDKTYGNLLSAHSVFEVVLVVIVVSVVPAICEETMFRGFIMRSFEFKMKPVWAALLTAVFFGIYHFNPYGLIPLIGLGFYFGFAAYKSNSIFVPMSLHFFNNFIAIIFYFIYGDEDIINSSVSKGFDLGSTAAAFVLLFALFGILLFFIHRYYSRKKIV